MQSIRIADVKGIIRVNKIKGKLIRLDLVTDRICVIHKFRVFYNLRSPDIRCAVLNVVQFYIAPRQGANKADLNPSILFHLILSKIIQLVRKKALP